jgi:WD40 repeat protein
VSGYSWQFLATDLEHIVGVYYQVFSPDGAIESKHFFSEGDPYTGRVVASRITPPHTVKCIKRFLCKQENISDFEQTDLFATITSDSGLSDQAGLQILSGNGPGSAADNPMALIINDLHPTSGGVTGLLPPSDLASSPIPFIPFSLNAWRLGPHKGNVYAVAFSPDGTKIVSGSEDKSICIWNSTSGQLVTGPILINIYPFSVAFSPNGDQIAVGCYDRTYIRLRDVYSGTPVSYLFEGHTRSVQSIAFSPDGQQIASGSYDKTIMIWDLQLGKVVVGPIRGHRLHQDCCVLT